MGMTCVMETRVSERGCFVGFVRARCGVGCGYVFI